MKFEIYMQAIADTPIYLANGDKECIPVEQLAVKLGELGMHTHYDTVMNWLTINKDEDLIRALVMSGFEPIHQMYPGWNMVPNYEGIKAVVLRHTLPATSCKKLRLEFAMGLPVEAVTAVLDDSRETIVYMHLVGPELSVRANWAALMGGGKIHWVGTAEIKLGGAKNHQQLHQKLPSGWKSWIAVHNQLSFPHMDPGVGWFYVLGDPGSGIHAPKQNPPSGFFVRLHKAVSLPLQSVWAATLWAAGIQHHLISQLPPHETLGLPAWVVKTAGWQDIVVEYLQKELLAIK